MNMQDMNQVGLELAAVGVQASGAGAAAGPYNGAKLHLTASLVPVGVQADLTTLLAAESGFGGYVAPTLTFQDAASVAANGSVEIVSAPVTFRATNVVTPQSAFCVFITDSTGAVLLSSGQLDTPLNFQDTLHQAVFTLRWRPQAGLSQVDVIA